MPHQPPEPESSEPWTAAPDPTGGWADGRSTYLIEKQVTGEARFIGGLLRPRWRNRSARHAVIGFACIVGGFLLLVLLAFFVTAK